MSCIINLRQLAMANSTHQHFPLPERREKLAIPLEYYMQIATPARK